METPLIQTNQNSCRRTSMDRPEEFLQDFDWKYTRDAKMLSELDWESFAEYKGDK